MSFLRDEGYIKIIQPELDRHSRLHGKPHYRVAYDIVVIVENRNLRYEARWPSKTDVDTIGRILDLPERSEIKQRGQLSLAAAFYPGTG